MSQALTSVGGAVLKIGGQIAFGLASTTISRLFDTRTFEGPRLEGFRLMASTEGASLPRAFGRVRVGGQVIWATHLRETTTEDKVGKGGPTQITYSYSISIAVALCEGEIAGVERIWANGEVIPTADLSFRVHKGTADQLPDPLIQAVEGDTPAYRGTAYIVFEDFPLDAYGGRLPQLNFEVIRPPARTSTMPRLEDLVTGVNLLPGSGEFAYETQIIEARGLPGATFPVNLNNPSGLPDAVRAVEQLEDQLPNCRSVNIISSWFGTDLRAGHCEIRPGVETRERRIEGEDWRVGDIRRRDAYLVTQVDGSPVYGGTPSDASLIALIRLLRERGFEVNLYPFILMDVAANNPMGQSPFPWRGRITAASTQAVSDFFGKAQAGDFETRDGVDYDGENAFGFRRFILHHAALAKVAGGVSRFVIGSEMVGLTTSLAQNQYPAVAEFRDLAAEVRKMLPSAKLTYAADWTEYRGHQVGGDLTYHLDPLWADANIDLVAIDAYFPLSDWRQASDHLDAWAARSIHDLDYLSSNVEGGEGFEYYYANSADRAAQIRSAITDPVYAYKNVRHWWGTPHFDKAGGVVSSTPTAWQPGSKPIWFSEIGCPAIDRGANQPNVFVDAKSSESSVPYFSSGERDDLIQRNYLRAFIDHYQDDPMVDGLHVWCWDTRPFPDFPARTDVWADGPNWQLGHWLSGRMGRVALGDLIADVCRDLAVEVDVSRVSGLVEGFALDRPMSVRAALQSLCEAFAIDVVEAPDRLVFRSRTDAPPQTLSKSDLADTPLSLTEGDATLLPGDIRLGFLDSARDHQPGLVSGALRLGAANPARLDVPVVMDAGLAQTLATSQLAALREGSITVEGWLAPETTLRVGDRVSLPDSSDVFALTRMEGPLPDGVRFVAVRRPGTAFSSPLGAALPETSTPVPWVSAPALFAFELPGYDGLVVGAVSTPFRPVTLENGPTLTAPVRIGYLDSALAAGPTAMVDTRNSFTVAGMRAKLDSAESVLPTANRFAVETPTGWEVLAARDVELVGEARYHCSHLLRGLDGSDADMADLAPGARVVWLGLGVDETGLERDAPGDRVAITAAVGNRTATIEHIYTAAHLRPLSPVHVKARRTESGIIVSFIRRSRQDTGWGGLDIPLGEDVETFRVEVLSGSDVVSVMEVDSPAASFSANENATHVRVAQGSSNYGWGATATAPIL